MKGDRVLSLIGLAKRAGKVASGEYQTEQAIRHKKAFLVIVAEDASDNTKKNFSDACTFYKVPLRYYSTKDELGQAMGLQSRASLALLDEGLSEAIQRNFE